MTEESAFTLEQLKRQVLSKLDSFAVLVGGQALAYWADYFEISLSPTQLADGVTCDADILGDRSAVEKLADAQGAAVYPSQNAMTALVGQVRIPIGGNEYLNIDIINRIVGIDANTVRRRSLEVRADDIAFHVMHPLDVLHSRVENLARIPDKRNDKYINQTRLSIAVACAYIGAIATEPEGRRSVLKAIEYIVDIAKSSAGRKVSREFGIDFLPAIPARLIDDENFHRHRWPHIVNDLAADKAIRHRSDEHGAARGVDPA